MNAPSVEPKQKTPWYRSFGPALITACVVFGPGSLLINSRIGAEYGYGLLWLLLFSGLLMGTFMTMGARIGVAGGGTPCQLVAARLGRPAAIVLGATLFLICSSFQFSNNIAVTAAADALGIARLFGDPDTMAPSTLNFINSGILLLFNAFIIAGIFLLRQVYRALERVMKIMVAVVLISFAVNLLFVQPSISGILGGLIPRIPEPVTRDVRIADDENQAVALTAETEDEIHHGLVEEAEVAAVEDTDMLWLAGAMILVASLLGTTFSVGGAFFQGNLVREKGWTLSDYDNGFRDAIAGVCVLTGVSAMIMITAGTALAGLPPAEISNIGVLAQQLRPLLGPVTHLLFSIGLLAVAMNPFVINSMIGGTVLADGLGKSARMSDPWPRRFTMLVLLVGMVVAMIVIHTPIDFVDAIVFGAALTVIGNPLMAAALLWLANRRDVMGERRNGPITNILGAVGFLAVMLMASRVIYTILLPLIWG